MLSKFWWMKISIPYFYKVIIGCLVFIFLFFVIYKRHLHNKQELTEEQLTLRESISVLAANPNWDLLKNYNKTISKRKSSLKSLIVVSSTSKLLLRLIFKEPRS